MTATKEQERKALEQIRKIVAGLGEGSYISTAFAGCFEDAEENIENDFANSMKGRYEQATKEAEHFRKAASEISEELDKLRDECAGLRKSIAAREDDVSTEHRMRLEETSRRIDAEDACKTLEVEIHDRDMKIMELKAKLYDMIVERGA